MTTAGAIRNCHQITTLCSVVCVGWERGGPYVPVQKVPDFNVVRTTLCSQIVHELSLSVCVKAAALRSDQIQKFHEN